MRNYYIIKINSTDNSETLLEKVTAKNEREARIYASRTYLSEIDFINTKLCVVGDAGFKQYHADKF